jgi:GPH family glycoside/pentoside/hexuronide:cation symporter
MLPEKVRLPRPAAEAGSGGRGISAGDRIPQLQKLLFAAGVIAAHVPSLMFNNLWMPVFNIGFGVNPVVLGGILMIMRAWDAFTDPVIGNLSDNTRTRWGRRRPLLFLGAITTALICPLFWNPPRFVLDGTSWLSGLAVGLPFWRGLDPGEQMMAVYLTLIGLMFFTSFTVWSMPFYSMQMELTPNYDERTRLAAWMTFFSKFAALGASWVLVLVMGVGALALGDPSIYEGKPSWFAGFLSGLQPLISSLANPQPDEKPIVVGVRLVSWGIAACILVFGLLPALFVKERYYKAETRNQRKDPFWKSLGESFRCKPLWGLIAIDFFLILGNSSVMALAQYVNFYYVFDGDIARASVVSGLRGSVVVVFGIALIPVATWLTERFDKRSVVMGMLGFSMVGHLLNYVFMTPEHPYWQILPAVFESSAVASVFLLLPSMKADVADWDELHTGLRREGALNAFFSWFVKAALTAAMGLSGVLLQFSGFDAKLGAQPPEVSNRMFLIYLVFPLVIWSLSLVAAWFYPMNRAKCLQIRADLEARRGVI